MNDTTTSDDLLEPEVKMSDEELIRLERQWLSEAEPFYNELKTVHDKNENYYLGKQTDIDLIPRHKCNAVENLIFMGVETIVPVMTANPAQFACQPAQDNENSAELARTLQEVLNAQYKNMKVKKHLELAARNMVVYRYGCVKMYWDEYIDDWNLKSVRPHRIWIPKYGSQEDDLPFVIEKIDMTIEEIGEYFGNDKKEEVKKIRRKPMDGGFDAAVTVRECWTNDFVFWTYGGIVLKKQKNPYFDFTGRKEETTDELGNAVVEDVAYNHFRRPRKPYIFLSPFRLGKSIVGETSLIEQGIPIQDVNNTLLRQIVNNAKKMGNGAWFVDSGVMTEEEARNKITNEEGIILYGQDAANEAMMRRESPPPLPEYIAQAKQFAMQSFDNIFGTHSTTRGERGTSETLGGRIMLKQGDISRIDLLVREIDRTVAEIGNWATQMMKLFYVSQKTIKIYGEKGIKFLTFSRNAIEDGVEVLVEEGSTLQTDEVSRRNEALQLYQMGALDPVTLYQRLKFPNPEESAQKLMQWMQGQAGGTGQEMQTIQSPTNEIAQARQTPTGGGGL